jgi:hypothetical protein
MAIEIALLPPERAWDGYEVFFLIYLKKTMQLMFYCCTNVLRNYTLEIENGIDAEKRVGARQFVDYNRSLWLV